MKKSLLLTCAATLLCASAAVFPPQKAARKIQEARSANLSVQTSNQRSGISVASSQKAFRTDLSKERSLNISKAPGMPDFFGAVISSTSLSKGVYEIPSDPQGSFVKQKMENSNNVVDASQGGVRQGKRYYSVWSEELFPGFDLVYVNAWDVDNSGWVKRWEKDGESNLMASDYALDPSTNTIYGSLNDDDDGYELCTVVFPDYKSREITRTVKGSLAQPLYAMAFTTDGVLYALQADGEFVTIDKTSGQATTIGSSGLNLGGKGSGVIDPTTGKFYCTAQNSGLGGLYEINITTGGASLVYEFPGNEQITGLYCNPSEAVAAAPGKATDISADFPNGELSGTVSFSAPQTDANGNAAQGELSYTISDGTNTLAEGTTEYGGNVKASVELKSEGEHTLTVIVANGSGASEPASIKVRVGKGLPKSPEISAQWNGQVMIVSWTPVTESADGGYIDPAEITYKVTRFPGNVTVADGIKETSLADVFVHPSKFTVYHYEIEASYADKTSAIAKSPNVGVGAYSTPYTQDFGGEFYRDDLIDTYTIVDANNDGEGWLYNQYTEVMRCRTMSNKAAADDWLILPAISMKKGMAYELTARLKDGGNTLKESFKVMLGDSNTPESMTVTLIPDQYVESESYKDYKVYINPTADGDYYIGFHCTTPEAAYYLYLDDISVVEKSSAGIAQAPENMTVIPDENGLHTATVSFTAPTLTVSGAPIVELDRIAISRDDEEVHSIPNPVPGETYTWVDSDIPAGDHDWSVIAYNLCGAGDPACVTAFIGIHKPTNPAWATAEETTNPGEVYLKWAPVNTDENGKTLEPGKITYSVVHLLGNGDESEIIAEDITETSLTFRAIPEGDQAFMNFAVFAHTEGGYSQGVVSPQIIVGTPYSLPYRESFSNNGSPETQLSVATTNGSGYWTSISDETFVDLKSHDHDSGYAAMAAVAEGDKASLTTAKISLKDAINPVLSFYLFNMLGDWGKDDNIMEVEVGVNGVYKTVYNKPNYQTGEANQWNLVAIPLSDYVGKDIQIRFTATCVHASYTVLDEIQIKPWAFDDLRAVDFTAPERLVAGEQVHILAEIENIGLNSAQGGAIVLYANDRAHIHKELPYLESGKSLYVPFDFIINPSFGNSVKLNVKVDLYEDLNNGNDRTESKTLSLEQTLLPAPSALIAHKVEGNRVDLSWDAPDMSLAVAARHTEDFENAEAWKSEVEGWTFHDLDMGGINGFDQVTFPGIPDGSQQSFWVMDDRLEDLNNTFKAFSGNKYIANMNVVDDITDDWAVSPLLCGKAQTISFMARSYNWMYPETFSVFYSTTGTAPEDFINIKDFEYIPWDWKEYSVSLPEGSKYFAIRSYFDDGVMLFIDDVKFVPEGTPQELKLLGYNFYSDGILVNKAPITECNYTYDGYNPTGHLFTVTALYDKGESGPSNALTPSGVENVKDNGISVNVIDRSIIIEGADGNNVIISGSDGILVYSGFADGKLTISVEPGIYIVRAGNATRKLIVK